MLLLVLVFHLCLLNFRRSANKQIAEQRMYIIFIANISISLQIQIDIAGIHRAREMTILPTEFIYHIDEYTNKGILSHMDM